MTGEIEISPEGLKRKLDNREDILLLDVREQWEAGICRLPNSVLIPVS